MTNNIKTVLFLFCCIFIFTNEIVAKTLNELTKDSVSQIAYGTQPTWKVTSSSSSIKGEELGKSFTQNPLNGLYGLIPGLTVMQGSGEPGKDAPGIFARGINSFTGNQNQKVLVILDGFENSMDQLVYQEIESITLLKDASALAIYGTKGANGVLLVTTKRGKISPLRISFSSQVGWQNPMGLTKFLDASNYVKLYNEANVNDGKAPLYNDAQLAEYNNAGADQYLYPNVNWSDELLKKSSVLQNYNLTLQGGNKIVSYFTLLNVSNADGIFKGTDPTSELNSNINVTRYNLRSNIDVNVTKDMKVAFTLGALIQDRNSPMYVNSSGVTTYEAAGLFDNIYSTPANAFPIKNPNGSYGGNSTWTNPIGNLLGKGFSGANSRNLQTTLELSQKLDFITKGLKVAAAISFNSYFIGYTNKTVDYPRYSILKDPTGTYQYTQYGQKASLAIDEWKYSQWRNLIYQGIIDYDRTFGLHAISANLVVNSQKYVTSGTMPYKNNKVGGRLNYAFDSRYIAELSFGYNGTENFAPRKRYGFFPAASAGWVISNEKFLANSKVVNFLKIRGSYGLTGNDLIGGDRFMYDKYYGYGNEYYLGDNNTGIVVIEELRMNNPNLTWEKQNQANIGIDGTLFKRLSFAVDFFQNNRYDILAIPYSTVPTFAGMTMPYLNVGMVKNKGFEASLRYESKPEASFQYFVEAKAWYAQNKITEMSEQTHQYGYQYQTGKPINQPFGLVSLGLFNDAADIANSPRQLFGDVQPGDVKYKDLNKDDIIDNQDFTAIGNSAHPTLTGSLTFGASLNGFDFQILAQGVANRTVSLTGNYYWAFQNNTSAPAVALTRWTPETAATATYPRLSSDYNQNNYQSSDFWQRDGDFVKIRNIEIGYSIPENTIKSLRLKTLRLFVNGTNLFSFDHLGNLDPETIAGYPALRTVSAGIKFQF